MPKLYDTLSIKDGLAIRDTLELFSGFEIIDSGVSLIPVPEPQNLRVTVFSYIILGNTPTWNVRAEWDAPDVPVDSYEIRHRPAITWLSESGLSRVSAVQTKSEIVDVRSILGARRSSIISIPFSDFIFPTINAVRNLEVEITNISGNNEDATITWDEPSNVWGRTVTYELYYSDANDVITVTSPYSASYIGGVGNIVNMVAIADGERSAVATVRRADFILPTLEDPTSVIVRVTQIRSTHTIFNISWNAPSDAGTRQITYEYSYGFGNVTTTSTSINQESVASALANIAQFTILANAGSGVRSDTVTIPQAQFITIANPVIDSVTISDDSTPTDTQLIIVFTPPTDIDGRTVTYNYGINGDFSQVYSDDGTHTITYNTGEALADVTDVGLRVNPPIGRADGFAQQGSVGFRYRALPENVVVRETAGGSGFNYTVTWDAPGTTIRTIDYYEISIEGGLFFQVNGRTHSYSSGGATANIRVRTHFTNGSVSDSVQVDRYDYNPDDMPIGLHVVYQGEQASTPLWRAVWFRPRGYTPEGYQFRLNAASWGTTFTGLQHDFTASGTTNFISVRADLDGTNTGDNIRLNQSDWTRLQASNIEVESTPQPGSWRIRVTAPLGVAPASYEWRHVDNLTWRSFTSDTLFGTTEDGDEWIEVRAVYNISDQGLTHTYYSNVIRVPYADWTDNG